MDIALDICLDIFGKAYPEIKGLHASESIEEYSENLASVRLVLFEENRRSSFAEVEVEVANTDEIASATIPYLKSLLEIHSKYTTDLEPAESGSV